MHRFLLACLLLWMPEFCTAQVLESDRTLESAFGKTTPEVIELSFPATDLNVLAGGHLQGVQIVHDESNQRYLAFLSHDSVRQAYVVVVAFPQSLQDAGEVIHIHKFPEGRLRHAGGIQILDRILVVGLEDNRSKDRSEVQFWDVSDVQAWQQLRHLTVSRQGPPKDQTAGAVGLAELGGDHLLAVANWDSRDIDFYTAHTTNLRDETSTFQHDFRWSVNSADRSTWEPDEIYGSFQAINLLQDSHDNLFLLGFHQGRQHRDFADLFRLDMTEQTKRRLTKIASKQVQLTSDSHFKYGGGMSIQNAQLWLLSSQRNLSESTRINIVRQIRR